LNTRALARHLDIPLHPLSALTTDDAVASIEYVYANNAVLSAMTIFPDWPRARRLVIFNDHNSAARQNSDVAHELAHGLLLHEPRSAIANGCRDYDKTDEHEAAWLSGCLLVPREAAVLIAKGSTPIADAAHDYGCSNEMMTWRINSTGARKQAAASRRVRSA
jgi:Zn-dependent peptidase ImmA (M78 family)